MDGVWLANYQMIRKLTSKDKNRVLDFAYLRERENLFVIGSFKNYQDPFKANDFWGYFKDGMMIGLAVFFRRFGNFVVNAQDKKAIYDLVDYALNRKIKIQNIAVFEKYAKVMMVRMKNKHKIIPKKISKETVFVLDKKNFKNFSAGDEEVATKKDVDEIVWFNTGKKATDKERGKIFPHQEFILRGDGKIVSKANIHGVSKNFFQIGGVGTREEHRGKGYAKKVVSSLCKYYFDRGIPYGLLFTANTNIPAQKVYKSIGFKAVDKFIIAEY